MPLSLFSNSDRVMARLLSLILSHIWRQKIARGIKPSSVGLGRSRHARRKKVALSLNCKTLLRHLIGVLQDLDMRKSLAFLFQIEEDWKECLQPKSTERLRQSGSLTS